MLISDPDIEKVIPSPSASVASTVPIAVWFSLATKLDEEVIVGGLLPSSKSITVTVIFWVVSSVPSLAVTVAV